jgi:hypothetical protein
MRSRDQILSNLEAIYRESYDRAKGSEDANRMADLDCAFVRDQLTMELLLDIRDLFAVAPAAAKPGSSALERLQNLRRLAKLR